MKIRSFGFVVVLSLAATSVACNKDSGAGAKPEAASTTAGDPCAAATWKIDSGVGGGLQDALGRVTRQGARLTVEHRLS